MINRKVMQLTLTSMILISANVRADDVNATYVATPIELKNSWQINMINAPYLWKYNVSGFNVKIGEIDTGIYQHGELKGRVLAGYDFVSNKVIAANTSSDDNGHGTHVAGIIAANINNNAGSYDVVGVAPLASLIPIKVLDKNGSGTLTNLVRGLDYSVSAGANIVSMSLGWSGGTGDISVASALQRSVSAGQLLVLAAGNSGLANPDWPARYAKQAFANGQIIAVGAVDINNVMPTWSNKAGDTANFYLVAPGVSILSTYNQPYSYAYMSGTSMATPVVSGAAALLKQGWNLSAKQIANILFTTATDLGTPGVDSTFGWGLLNLEKAMAPIGTPTFPTLTKYGVTITTKSVAISASTTPVAYKSALAGANLKVAGLDSMGRDYLYDFSSLYNASSTNDLMLGQIFNAQNTNASLREYKTKDSKLTLGQTNANTFEQMKALEGDRDTALTSVTSMFYSKHLSDNNAMALGMNTNTNHFFGFSDTPFEYAGFMSKKAFDNPYLTFDGYQNFVGYSAALPDHWMLAAGAVSNFDAVSRQASTVMQTYQTNQRNLNAGFIELSKQTGQGKFAIAVGSNLEQASMLGGSAGELFGITNQSSTVFLSLKNTTKLSKDTWMAASLNNGFTLNNGAQNSLVTSTNNISSQSWSVGLLSNNVFSKNDRLGFAVSQPLAVKSGNMNLMVPVGLNYESGVMQYENRAISLAPRAVEHDVEVSYNLPTSKTANVSLSALYRMNPDNNAEIAAQRLLTVFWRAGF